MSAPTQPAADELVSVAVDRDACIGGGQCEMLEEATFLLDDDTMVASVVGSGRLPRSRAEIVVDRCPGRAISIMADTIGPAEEEPS